MSFQKPALAVALFAAATLSVGVAEARGRMAHGEFQTRRGTAVGDRTVTKERGLRSATSTWTGPGGKSTSMTDTRAVDRAAGTYSHDRQRTFSDGSTRSVDTDVQKTGDGTFSGTRTVTGRNGETRTQTGDFATTKTEDGRSLTGTIQTQNHGEVDYQRDVSHADGVRSVNSSATFEDGTSRTRSTSTSRDPATGVVTTNGTFTNRNGAATTVSNVRTPTDTGATVNRDITYPDGSTRSVDRTTTVTGPGTADVTRTVTGRDGETRTQTGTVVVTPK